jgi:hypothetical protein
MTVVNDVHSQLNATEVDTVVPVDSLESIGAALDLDRSERRPNELFQSDWYRWLRTTIELEAAA